MLAQLLGRLVGSLLLIYAGLWGLYSQWQLMPWLLAWLLSCLVVCTTADAPSWL